jgi:hypothetical protein
MKYGHDRLYVQTAAGTRLGYWDNKTGTAVLVDGADQAAFETCAIPVNGGRTTATRRSPPPRARRGLCRDRSEDDDEQDDDEDQADDATGDHEYLLSVA